MISRRFFASLSLLCLPVWGQESSNKPVSIVVPFPPGGSADPIARLIAVRLQERLGRPVIVENRAGASGLIGSSYVAKSAPDGNTLLLAFDTHATNPALVEKMPYDTEVDFAALALVGKAPMLLCSPAARFKTWASVKEAAKAKPATVNAAHVLNGSLGHLALVSIQKNANLSFINVPYKGAAAMATDLLGGHIDIGIGTVTSLGEHVKSQRLNPLAITGDARSPFFPDIPTLAELGEKPFAANAWWAMFVPAAVPGPLRQRLEENVLAVLNAPDVKRQLGEQMGVQVAALGAADTKAFVQSEATRWRAVISANGIKAD